MGKSSPKTISEAIRRLEQDAKPHIQSQLDHLKDLMEELKPYFEDVKDAVGEQATAAAEFGYAKAKQTSRDIDEAVHEKPWFAIAIIGFLCLLAGLLLGHRRR
jgi:ElaB/YqjD/DUF883 family membrane-anchored ribosome-binding protein